MVFNRMPEALIREGVRNKSEWFRAGRLDFPNAQTSRQSKVRREGHGCESELVRNSSRR